MAIEYLGDMGFNIDSSVLKERKRQRKQVWVIYLKEASKKEVLQVFLPFVLQMKFPRKRKKYLKDLIRKKLNSEHPFTLDKTLGYTREPSALLHVLKDLGIKKRLN